MHMRASDGGHSPNTDIVVRVCIEPSANPFSAGGVAVCGVRYQRRQIVEDRHLIREITFPRTCGSISQPCTIMYYLTMVPFVRRRYGPWVAVNYLSRRQFKRRVPACF